MPFGAMLRNHLKAGADVAGFRMTDPTFAATGRAAREARP